jgi:RNA polymerase sigma-70 factor (sigma-E family)
MMSVTAEMTREREELAGLDDLYIRHAPAAVGLAYLLVGDRDVAQDLVHEAFVRLAGRLRHLRDRDRFDSYLRRTVVNLHLSGLRRLRLERSYLAREGSRPLAEQDHQAVEAARQDMWAALRKLPARQRAAVVLRYYEDLSERETAEVMRSSVASVKSLVARAMHALRSEIQEAER